MTDYIRDRLIVALDVDSAQKALDIADTLAEQVKYYKVGSQLFLKEGPSVITRLLERGCEVFLDLKLHDIPHTVARAVESLISHRVWAATVHCAGGMAMLEYASNVKNRPKLFAVTILTSLTEEDFERWMVPRTVSDMVLSLAAMAKESGIDGVVCSAEETAMVRSAAGGSFTIVTCGIRLADASDRNDQKRVATPGFAIASGADFIVMGRPVIGSRNPGQTLLRINDDIAQALSGRK